MELELLLFGTAAIFVIVGGVLVVGAFFKLGKKKSKSPYVKQPGFLSGGELKLYATLTEVCGSQYLVFPQVHLGRLLEVKKTVDWKDVSNYRSRIDRKPADFVICNTVGEALVVVELGGDGHNFPDNKSRDKFVDDLAQVEGLPLVYLKPGMSVEAAHAELQKVLPQIV